VSAGAMLRYNGAQKGALGVDGGQMVVRWFRMSLRLSVVQMPQVRPTTQSGGHLPFTRMTFTATVPIWTAKPLNCPPTLAALNRHRHLPTTSRFPSLPSGTTHDAATPAIIPARPTSLSQIPCCRCRCRCCFKRFSPALNHPVHLWLVVSTLPHPSLTLFPLSMLTSSPCHTDHRRPKKSPEGSAPLPRRCRTLAVWQPCPPIGETTKVDRTLFCHHLPPSFHLGYRRRRHF
jgi:hypothetical protein